MESIFRMVTRRLHASQCPSVSAGKMKKHGSAFALPSSSKQAAHYSRTLGNELLFKYIENSLGSAIDHFLADGQQMKAQDLIGVRV